jgi:hypothetical protein
MLANNFFKMDFSSHGPTIVTHEMLCNMPVTGDSYYIVSLTDMM